MSQCRPRSFALRRLSMHRPRHAMQSGAFPAPCVAMLCPRNERRCSALPPRCHARLNRASPSPRIADQRLAAALPCQAMPSPCHITRRIAFCPAPHSHAFASPRSVSPRIASHRLAMPARIKASHVRALPALSYTWLSISRSVPCYPAPTRRNAAHCHARAAQRSVLRCPCRAAMLRSAPQCFALRTAMLRSAHPALCHRHAPLRLALHRRRLAVLHRALPSLSGALLDSAPAMRPCALPCPLRRAVPRRARPSHARAAHFST